MVGSIFKPDQLFVFVDDGMRTAAGYGKKKKLFLEGPFVLTSA